MCFINYTNMSDKENKDKPKNNNVKLTVQPIILKSDDREVRALHVPKREKENKPPKKE